MPTQIELEFYKAFGIPTEERFYCLPGYCKQKPVVKKNSEKCRNCEYGHYYIVPEITDRQLLELICLTNQYGYYCALHSSIDMLKNGVISHAVKALNYLKSANEAKAKEFYHAVRKIMEDDK
ncbi:MAG: hypothetical protein NC191_09985 [Muribaculaceae bacterium]|nr:hypothetical protein [Muribaculaceae bacterium]